jgi:hypothetical protein
LGIKGKCTPRAVTFNIRYAWQKVAEDVAKLWKYVRAQKAVIQGKYRGGVGA